MNADEIFIPDISDGYYRYRWLSRKECENLAHEVGHVITVISGQIIDDELSVLSDERLERNTDPIKTARIDRMKRVTDRLGRVRKELLRGAGHKTL